MAYDWLHSSGRGTVFSYTVVPTATAPAFQARTPYPVALVLMDEGVYLVSELVDCRPDDVWIGMPVQVVFAAHGDITLPRFRPAQAC